MSQIDQSITCSAIESDETGVDVDYEVPENCKPNSDGHHLMVWTGEDTEISVSKAPLISVPVASDARKGTQTIALALTQGARCQVTYSVAAPKAPAAGARSDPSNVAAYAPFMVGYFEGEDGSACWIESARLVEHGLNSTREVSVRVRTHFRGTAQSGWRLAVWQGVGIDFNNAPLGATAFTPTGQSDWVSVKLPDSFTRHAHYTIGLFTSDAPTALAAMRSVDT